MRAYFQSFPLFFASQILRLLNCVSTLRACVWIFIFDDFHVSCGPRMSGCAPVCLPPTEMPGARGLELSLSCSLLNPRRLEQCPAQGRCLLHILKLIARSGLCFDIPSAPTNTQHLFVLRLGALGSLRELSISIGEGVAKMEIKWTHHSKINVSVRSRPPAQRHMVCSEFGLRDKRGACVSPGWGSSFLTWAEGTQAGWLGGCLAGSAPGSVPSCPPGRLHNLSGPPYGFLV